MPIIIPDKLPATQTLTDENVFAMDNSRAGSQEIRPLQILLLNLMPTKIDTETQIARVLANTPLQVELELMQMQSYESKNTSKEHMLKFYTTFDKIKDKYFDGMLITGAPIEFLEFEEVEYWQELCEIMEWSKSHVYSTFHICWGAQAGLYYHFGIQKKVLPQKMFGVFEHTYTDKKEVLLRGFDDTFMVPHSRNTTVLREDIEKCDKLKILATSEKAGVYACRTEGGRQVFVMGHSEYDAHTLANEYFRDKNAGIDIAVPENYFPNDDDTQPPKVSWRAHANLIYQNWINYIVYQDTPYIIDTIEPI